MEQALNGLTVDPEEAGDMAASIAAAMQARHIIGQSFACKSLIFLPRLHSVLSLQRLPLQQ